MSKGTYWIYRGNVSWQEDQEVKSANVEHKMEIVETVARKDGAVAVLKGHPEDLAWYSPGTMREDYLLVRIGDTRFYLLHGDEFDRLLARAKEPDQPLEGLVTDLDLILQLPLKEGARFGEKDQMDRPDGMYVWNVQNETRVKLTGIQGAPGGEHQEYSVNLSTNPDHTFISYVPGVGITSFLYGHHGTVSSANVRLVRFHRGD